MNDNWENTGMTSAHAAYSMQVQNLAGGSPVPGSTKGKAAEIAMQAFNPIRAILPAGFHVLLHVKNGADFSPLISVEIHAMTEMERLRKENADLKWKLSKLVE